MPRTLRRWLKWTEALDEAPGWSTGDLDAHVKLLAHASVMAVRSDDCRARTVVQAFTGHGKVPCRVHSTLLHASLQRGKSRRRAYSV